MQNIPGIAQVRDHDQSQDLRITPGCDPQQVLHELAARTAVTSFAVMRPSLQDTFVPIAGPAAQEDAGKESSAA